MKVLVYAPWLERSKIGDACFAELLKIYPEGDYGRSGSLFAFKLPRQDPRLSSLLATLKSYGHLPWKELFQRPGFDLQYLRQYSAKDWSESEYLTMFPRSWTLIRNLAEGGIGFDASETNHRSDFAGDKAGHRSLLVPDRVKNELERAKLTALRFEPALPVGEYIRGRGWMPIEPPPKRLGQWWVLTSDVVLPPLAPACDVRPVPDAMAKELLPDNSGWRSVAPPFPRKSDDPPYVSLHEGLFVFPELHYRRSDLDLVADFDAAVTSELFGSTLTGPSRTLIVSNRFYKVCRALDYRISWIPVRLD